MTLSTILFSVLAHKPPVAPVLSITKHTGFCREGPLGYGCYTIVFSASGNSLARGVKVISIFGVLVRLIILGRGLVRTHTRGHTRARPDWPRGRTHTDSCTH